MAKQLFLIGALLIPLLSYGQSPLAKLKFEQAQQLFAEGHYATAVEKLDEVEKTLGSSNPRILHMRILCEFGLVKSNQDKAAVLEKLKGHLAFYLKNYTQKGIEALYDEVKHINEQLSALAIAATTDQKTEDQPKMEANGRNYISSLAQKFNYSYGMPAAKFSARNPASAALLKSPGTVSGPLTYHTVAYKKSDPYPVGPYAARVDETEGVVLYTEVLFADKDEKAGSDYFKKLKTEIQSNVDPNFVSFEQEGKKILVNILGAEMQMEVNYVVVQKLHVITITFKSPL